MRRIEERALLKYLLDGDFNRYDKILFLQSREELLESIKVPKLKLWLRFCNKLYFFGPVFYCPNSAEIKQIGRRYDDGRPIIVFNAGAGGEHWKEGFCDKLFDSAIKIAERFHKKNISAKIVIIKGSNYQKEIISPNHLDNVAIVDYEPKLAALFHIAKVCVLRPGYNSVHEALSGKSQVILIPSVSYLEQQEIWVKELENKYQAYCLMPDYTIQDLENVINQMLPQDLAPHARIISNAKSIALSILQKNKSGKIPTYLCLNMLKMPKYAGIDDDIAYENNEPHVSFYLANKKSADNCASNLLDRAIIGIDMHKISARQELEYLFQRNAMRPLAVFLNYSEPTKFLNRLLNEYNREIVSAEEVAGTTLEGVL